MGRLAILGDPANVHTTAYATVPTVLALQMANITNQGLGCSTTTNVAIEYASKLGMDKVPISPEPGEPEGVRVGISVAKVIQSAPYRHPIA